MQNSVKRRKLLTNIWNQLYFLIVFQCYGVLLGLFSDIEQPNKTGFPYLIFTAETSDRNKILPSALSLLSTFCLPTF